ncbi:MAG: GAK system CofD-like protein, partial [Desulfosalsimonas sp.]
MKQTESSPVYFEINRTARLPDPVRLARYEKLPDLGPRLLFFSGGTALRELSAQLIGYTHNSIHIITPFDSGGSSAELRRVFHMPA